MESVHSDTAKMMAKSTKALTALIGGGDKTKKKKKKSKKKSSVTKLFFSGIKTLMKNLSATEPYFVRCVNPNKQKSSKAWNVVIVEHQLRCGGLVEALRVLKLGYPTRVPYSTLYDKYHGNVTNPLIKNMGPESFSTALLIAFDVSEDDYELGLTKIFFKPAKAAVLDKIMGQAGQPLSAAQNEKITKWVVQKRIKQMVGSAKAFLELRKRVRLTRASRNFRYAGRVASLIGGSVVRHLGLARESILKRKREAASEAMQSFFRGAYERSRYIKHVDKCKKATKIIWISYRRWQERVELQKFLDIKVEETRKRKEEEERLRREAERLRLIEEARLKAVEEAARAAMAASERGKELARQRAEAEARKQAELEAAREVAKEAERKRLEEERIKLAEKEREAEEERKRKAEEEERLKKEEEERLELEKEAKRKEQMKSAQENQLRKKEIETDRKARKRSKRNDSAKLRKRKRISKEHERRQKLDDDYIERNYPEMVRDGTDSGSETDSSTDGSDTSEEPVLSLKEQLRNFDKVAKTGQLFLKYTGKRRRKPQDRIVKVSFDQNRDPKQISWGSGSRHIDFSDVLYIAAGHWTPVFQARKETLDEKLCFSVVGKQQILDVQTQTEDMALLWVKGLRKLIGQSDEEAEKLSKKNLASGNLPGHKSKEATGDKQNTKLHKKRTKSLMLLQQDLFVMTTTTVFRNLDEERIFHIDQNVRDKFNAKTLYEQALREDIPWRQWNHWIREKIVTYLRINGLIVTEVQAHPQQQQQQFPPQNMHNPYVPPQQQPTDQYQQYNQYQMQQQQMQQQQQRQQQMHGGYPQHQQQQQQPYINNGYQNRQQHQQALYVQQQQQQQLQQQQLAQQRQSQVYGQQPPPMQSMNSRRSLQMQGQAQRPPSLLQQQQASQQRLSSMNLPQIPPMQPPQTANNMNTGMNMNMPQANANAFGYPGQGQGQGQGMGGMGSGMIGGMPPNNGMMGGGMIAGGGAQNMAGGGGGGGGGASAAGQQGADGQECTLM